jgi:hypothetical protein
VYWVGHHVQLSFIRRADRPLLWINILFLLWVALVPFSTALLSEYSKTRLAIAIYGANLIAIGLTLALHWWYATTESRHVDPDIHPGLVRAAMYRTLMAPLVYVIAIGLSFFRPEASLALYALVPILYILPGRIDIHRKVKARTVTVALSKEQAELYEQAIANHRRLEEVLRQMRELSEQVLLDSAPGVRKRPRQKHPKASLT